VPSCDVLVTQAGERLSSSRPLCSGTYIYFYRSSGSGTSYQLNLITRRLSDLAPMGSTLITFDDATLSAPDWGLQLDSINENPE
jgi:hypothetical protein